jgi:pentatricopeptide repeat protein
MTASESIGACAMDQRSQAPAVSRRRPYAALVAIAAVGHTPHTCNAFTASTGRTGVSVWTAHAARQRQGWAAGAQGTLLRTSTAPHFDTVAEYTESILACEQKGEAGFDLAYGLYLELKPADGPKPDAELFAAVLRLCAAAHRWEHALDVLKDMQQAGVPADEDCYASALKACKRAGRCQDARRWRAPKRFPLSCCAASAAQQWALERGSRAAASHAATVRRATECALLQYCHAGLRLCTAAQRSSRSAAGDARQRRCTQRLLVQCCHESLRARR